MKDSILQNFDVIIIGAGASGLACAAEALRRKKSVAIFEHTAKQLQKVSISGGGKCNFTNLCAQSQNYLSENQHFCISALKQFSPHDMLELINQHNIKYYEKTPNQLFCMSSSAIVELLKQSASGAKVFYNTVFKNIYQENNLFTLNTNQGDFSAASLVIATGGASYPNLGASEFGYQLAKQFGHKIIPYKPALVPLNLDNELMKKTIGLKGVAVPAKVKIKNKTFQDNILFTHFGLSGPAILQASLYWDKGDVLSINLLPELDLFQHLKEMKQTSGKKSLSTILKTFFPERLVNFLLNGQEITLADVSSSKLQEICQNINNWQVIPIGTQGFQLAEVTRGGVDVNQISSQTLESKIVAGLFIIGEVLDVTGQLGGYNLQWAWSSGFTAGKYV